MIDDKTFTDRSSDASRWRDSVHVILSLEEDNVMNAEKIILGIQTCSVSVSENTNFNPFCDRALACF